MKKQYTKIICNGKIVFTARLYRLSTGRYGFETSENGKPFVINMNMPTFGREKEAVQWIENQPEWKYDDHPTEKGGEEK